MSESQSLSTEVRERPIIFSGPMVRAILDGRKTQTRRLVKGAPEKFVRNVGVGPCSIRGDEFGAWFNCVGPTNPSPHNYSQFVPCPYGKPGERLWVREKSAYAEAENGNELRVYGADNSIADVYQLGDGPKSLNGFLDEKWDTNRHGRLKFTPSIHMPRWASRITLEVTGVRVERLQDITELDAKAEGAGTLPNPCGYADTVHFACCREFPHLPRNKFQHLWVKLNGQESWDANPWVWVVEFRKLPSC